MPPGWAAEEEVRPDERELNAAGTGQLRRTGSVAIPAARGGMARRASPDRVVHDPQGRLWCRPAHSWRGLRGPGQAASAGPVTHIMLCVKLWKACAEQQSGCAQEEISGDYRGADSRKRDVNRETIVHTLWTRQK